MIKKKKKEKKKTILKYKNRKCHTCCHLILSTVEKNISLKIKLVEEYCITLVTNDSYNIFHDLLF